MPRLSYVTSPSYIAGQQRDEPLNECLDFCQECWLQQAYEDFIPDGLDRQFVDLDADHPPYEGDEYNCAACGCELGEEDN